MKKKLFGLFLLAVLTISMSVAAFAFDELYFDRSQVTILERSQLEVLSYGELLELYAPFVEFVDRANAFFGASLTLSPTHGYEYDREMLLRALSGEMSIDAFVESMMDAIVFYVQRSAVAATNEVLKSMTDLPQRNLLLDMFAGSDWYMAEAGILLQNGYGLDFVEQYFRLEAEEREAVLYNIDPRVPWSSRLFIARHRMSGFTGFWLEVTLRGTVQGAHGQFAFSTSHPLPWVNDFGNPGLANTSLFSIMALPGGDFNVLETTISSALDWIHVATPASTWITCRNGITVVGSLHTTFWAHMV